MFNSDLPRKKLILYSVIFLHIFLLPFLGFSQTPVLKFSPVVTSGLSSPLDIVSPGDGSGRLFVVEKTGTVHIISGGTVSATPFLDVSGLISTASERGLLSLAFHPQYALNRYFFIYYVNTSGNITIARYQTALNNPLSADPASGQVLLTIPHPGQSNHNGGKLNFGPDGNLYFGVGDGGGGGDVPNNAQTGTVLLGKMIRINVNNFATSAPFYTIPADNPFVSTAGVAGEIYDFGLRNPFRWSFDRLTHDMWIGDVGQDLWEEVDFRTDGNTSGLNYGWHCYEATHAYNTSGCGAAGSYVTPVFEYSHNNVTGGSSVTGGYVYRGSAYPGLYGYYVMADYVSGNVWLMKPDGAGGWNINMQSGLPGGIVAFGEDANGELYAVSITNSTVYQVQLVESLPVKLQSFTVTTQNGAHILQWKTSSEQNLQQFEAQYSSDGIAFQTIGIVPATNAANGNSYQFSHAISLSSEIFYRLKILDKNGKEEYSSIIKINNSGEQPVRIAPTLVQNNKISIQLNKPFKSLQLLDMNGRVLKSRNLDQGTGMIYLDVPDVAKGMYMIRLRNDQSDVYTKIMVR